MNEQLNARIKNDFPNVDWSGRNIECGTGWAAIVYAFLADATKACGEAGGKLVIDQIKSKFGTLRLYCHQSGGATPEEAGNSKLVPEAYGQVCSLRPYPKNPSLLTLVKYYESASAHCCELCGKAGHIDAIITKERGCVISLCFSHAKLYVKSHFYENEKAYEDADAEATKDLLARIDAFVKRAQDGDKDDSSNTSQ